MDSFTKICKQEGIDNLLCQDDQRLKNFADSIFIDEHKMKTISYVVSGLEGMLEEKMSGESLKKDELLNKAEFSENYYLKNAEKFKLDLFQLKPGSNLKTKEKYSVESFEAVKQKVVELETKDHKKKKNKNKKIANCGVDCLIFRRLLI